MLFMISMKDKVSGTIEVFHDSDTGSTKVLFSNEDTPSECYELLTGAVLSAKYNDSISYIRLEELGKDIGNSMSNSRDIGKATIEKKKSGSWKVTDLDIDQSVIKKYGISSD